jgi:nucleotide-binding universal stress UspA family protein
MYKRILVTLDGSDLSERALEPAFLIAQRFDAQIVLLRVVALDVVSVAGGMGPQYYELRRLHEEHDRQEAEQYLHALKALWQGTGVPIETRVICGAPPEMILDAAASADADLIVMSTHGRTGLNRLLYGSVAEAVLRGTRWPVLLIPIK